MRGVNLGGWFVLEPYMNSNLWSEFTDPSNIPVDEYHFCSYYGKDTATAKLTNHWNTYYTESDFVQIKAAGLNTVRIPIGYWAFGNFFDEPYVQGQVPYILRALQWARNQGLEVMLDLHGAPGSQNGFDNSGLRDTIQFPYGKNPEYTLTALQRMVNMVFDNGYSDVVTSIEILNEPLAPSFAGDALGMLKDFYQKGYNIIRYRPDGTMTDLTVAFHDAFYDPASWNNYLPAFSNSYEDNHHYQVFTPDLNALTIDQHVGMVCGHYHALKAVNLPVIVGEWSAALTDCCPMLNGVYRGARYDGTYGGGWWIGDCSDKYNPAKITGDYYNNMRRFVEAQLDAWEKLDGWIFWAWKTDLCAEWNFQKLLAMGIMPQPLTTDRRYPNQCNF
ncbi:glycoside hydrolase family 5 protein [Tortispora caseinolytica NRRL Y-17796]|uniref:glucan 1,3-beta-glucosidase n=1 Tax=Tortispora caseinolytica NRRL Y-17796 TaxID=767744 RepID=A0A1E4THL5_9ASCO|nr:glycoside hydrolase family 5 protein [Tortispora caseinolytica NRRL Y-17796]